MEKEYLEISLPEDTGPEMDLLMARHMGAQAIESGGMPWLLDGNRAYAVPPYSTDHNAFFNRVVPYLRDRKILLEIKDEGDHFLVSCMHSRLGGLAEEKHASLPHAGCLAAMTALRVFAQKGAKQIGPRE